MLDKIINVAIIDSQNKVIQPTPSGALHKTSGLTPETIVIVPAEDILLLQAKLPKLKRHRLYQALPFALEEQLINEVSDLHFAIGEYQPDGTMPVAVVAKHKMDEWLTLLKEAGISASALIPASLALPYLPHQWHVVLHDSIAIARTGLYSGFACDPPNLDLFLQTALTTATKPDAISVTYYSQKKYDLKTTGVIENTSPANSFFHDMAQNMQPPVIAPVINLLQYPYQATQNKFYHQKIWFAACGLSLIWLLLLFCHSLLSIFILRHQEHSIDQAIEKIYKRNFPQATSLVAPKKRMTEKLDHLMQKNQHNPLLLWLTYIGNALSQINSIRIQELDYRQQQLRLELIAPDFESIDAFTKALTQSGLTVKQQNIAATGTQIKGTLLISEENVS